MILFEDSFVILSYEEDVPCFKYNHLKPVMSNELKEMLHKSVELISDLKKKHPNLTLNLADTRKLGAIDPEVMNYINSTIDPQMAELGIKKLAMIIPEDVFAQFNIEEYVESQNFGMKKGLFGNEENAINWLEKP